MDPNELEYQNYHFNRDAVKSTVANKLNSCDNDRTCILLDFEITISSDINSNDPIDKLFDGMFKLNIQFLHWHFSRVLSILMNMIQMHANRERM